MPYHRQSWYCPAIATDEPGKPRLPFIYSVESLQRAHLIDVGLRIVHLILGAIVLICLSVEQLTATLAPSNIVYFTAACAIITELALQVLESLHVPYNYSTPKKWTYLLMFLNVFCCVLYVASAAVTVSYTHINGGIGIAALPTTATAIDTAGNIIQADPVLPENLGGTPKGMQAAGFFLAITFMAYVATSIYYLYRYRKFLGLSGKTQTRRIRQNWSTLAHHD